MVAFFVELPQDLTRHIITLASRERDRIEPMRADHTDMDRVLAACERDQKVLGALRATNTGQPFRLNLPGNRMNYYELTQDIWRMRQLVAFKRKLQDRLPHMNDRMKRHYLYNQMWFTLHAQTQAIRAVAEEDPDALKRALCKLKAVHELEQLRNNPQPRDS